MIGLFYDSDTAAVLLWLHFDAQRVVGLLPDPTQLALRHDTQAGIGYAMWVLRRCLMPAELPTSLPWRLHSHAPSLRLLAFRLAWPHLLHAVACSLVASVIVRASVSQLLIYLDSPPKLQPSATGKEDIAAWRAGGNRSIQLFGRREKSVEFSMFRDLNFKGIAPSPTVERRG